MGRYGYSHSVVPTADHFLQHRMRTKTARAVTRTLSPRLQSAVLSCLFCLRSSLAPIKPHINEAIFYKNHNVPLWHCWQVGQSVNEVHKMQYFMDTSDRHDLKHIIKKMYKLSQTQMVPRSTGARLSTHVRCR